jgi:hypothetical protein
LLSPASHVFFALAIDFIATLGMGYPEIEAVTLLSIRREQSGFWIFGRRKRQRESKKQTSITDIHPRVANHRKVWSQTPASSNLNEYKCFSRVVIPSHVQSSSAYSFANFGRISS